MTALRTTPRTPPSLAILLVAAGCGPTIPGVDPPPPAPPAAGAEIRVTTDPGRQAHPAIWGDRVVWEDDRHGNRDIYLYDFGLGEEIRLTQDGADQSAPAIWEDRVVFTDGRHGGSDVYLHDLATGLETRLTQGPSSAAEPAIFGQLVAWHDEAVGTGGVYVHDLATGESERLSQAGRRARVWGDTVAWIRRLGCADPDHCEDDVELRDLGTGIDVVASGLRSEKRGLRLWGDRMVWMARRGVSLGTFGVDWDVMEWLAPPGDVVFAEEFARGASAVSEVWPTVQGGFIGWIEIEVGAPLDGGGRLFLGDLTTGARLRVGTTSAATRPEIYGRRIAWADEREGQWDIYAFELDP